MSRDIRSFFLPKGKSTEKSTEKSKKKRMAVIDSDSDDEKPSSKRQREETKPPKHKRDFLPEGKSTEKSTEKSKKKRVIVIESDSDEEKPSSKRQREETKPPKTKTQVKTLKPVNIKDVLSTEKVKRFNATTSKKSLTSQVVEEIHSDQEFEATLSQLDEIEAAYLKQEPSTKGKTEERETLGTSQVEKGSSVGGKSEASKEEENSRTPIIETSQSSILICAEGRSKDIKNGNSKEKKHQKTSQEEISNGTASVNVGINDTESKNENTRNAKRPTTPRRETNRSGITEESKIKSPTARKRQNAANYMKYLHREGPKHLGTKEVPKGKPGCLARLTFVITGVLDSLEREQAISLIEQYGGKISSNVSRNSSYVVCGDEPGPSKISKATTLGTPIIDEDGLFNLIKSKSNNSSIGEDDISLKQVKEQKERNDIKNRKCKIQEIKPSQIAENEMDNRPSSKRCTEPNQSSDTFVENKTQNFLGLPKKPSERTATDSKDVGNIKTEFKAIQHITLSSNDNSTLWVDKYRPTKLKQVIGQQGDRSSLKKLTFWLENWHKNRVGNKKHIKPSPWVKNDDGAHSKAALLSGPPGIGKTTMAHLVCKELGFDAVEFNASDTRSKKLLHLEISELLTNKSLFNYFNSTDHNQPSAKHVLIMDEVDGMAGNEDRGGVQELINLIKNTRIPIICMCNDRNHPKIRSLSYYCFDLRVPKPRLEQIKGAMMSVCYKEGLKISADALTNIVCGANFDMRQILHHLSMWSAKEKHLSEEATKKEAQKARKDMKLGPWDIVKKVFNTEDHKTMTIHDKSDLFFHDYSISPLFVQENYLSVVPASAKNNITKTLDCVAQTADAISMGDVVDKTIRSRGSWSLLPLQAMFASVIPGNVMEGYIRGQINFPSWLGKNSRRGKFDRLLQDLHVHMRLSTSGSKQALNADYLPHVRDAILRPLIQEGVGGVTESLRVLQAYNLLREDLESILELTRWPNQKDPMNYVESKVKAALTRAYNKEGILTPYSVSGVKKHSVSTSTEQNSDDEADGGEEENDDVTTDAMIKAKKTLKGDNETSVKGKRKVGSETVPKNSRGRGRGRGKK